jgi:ferric-dicitrate binding protein FerR (iron transport regulator)
MSNKSTIGASAPATWEPEAQSSATAVLRRALRLAYGPFCAIFGIGFAYLYYLGLGPAWVRGLIARGWDSATSAGMLDAVSGHRDARYVAFADGSSVTLSLMSWVHYPRVFKGPARIVSFEGQGEFVIRAGGGSFVVQAKPVSIETDEADFKVWGTELDPVCAIEVVAGRIKVSGVRGLSSELVAPRTWLRGRTCSVFDVVQEQSRVLFDTSSVRK